MAIAATPCALLTQELPYVCVGTWPFSEMQATQSNTQDTATREQIKAGGSVSSPPQQQKCSMKGVHNSQQPSQPPLPCFLHEHLGQALVAHVLSHKLALDFKCAA